MKKQTFLFLFLIIISAISIAQNGSVRGFVYDKKTGEPIIFSNVLLLNTNYGGSSDDDGYFVISKVPKGDYTIRVSFMGYEQMLLPINVKSDQITTLKIELEPNSKLLNAVEINAERLASKTESQVSIEKITSKDITQLEELPI